MEQYFEEIANKMEGYRDFEREAWSFKVWIFASLSSHPKLSNYLARPSQRRTAPSRSQWRPQTATRQNKRRSSVNGALPKFASEILGVPTCPRGEGQRVGIFER